MDRTVPRIIWVNWFQGWVDAPELVKACRRSWEGLNPGWEIRPLSNKVIGTWVDLESHFEFTRNSWHSPRVISNLLRMALLSEHGGVWADATLLATRPLDDWLNEATVSGFFAFQRTDPGRMLANWFLASTPGHPVIKEWSRRTTNYWRERDCEDRLFWHHKVFGDAYADDVMVRLVWESTPKHLAVERTVLQSRLLEPATDSDHDRIRGRFGPVEKLNHRVAPVTETDTVHQAVCAEWSLPRDPAMLESRHGREQP